MNKIFDCFIFFNEIELLELRIEILGPYVDHFVLVEAPWTHSGKPKELFFERHKSNFLNQKIIHIICPKVEEYKTPWELENLQRDYIREGLINADSEDIVMISDLDEIPNPEAINEAIEKLNTQYISFEQKCFYYYVNCLKYSNWRGTVMSKFCNMVSPNDMRDNRNKINFVENGGWHYSWIGGAERINLKIESFAHTEYNKDDIKNENHINQALKNNLDIFKRQDNHQVIELELNESNSPKCIKNWLLKYPHFLKKYD